jgi:hypothetical protein
MNYAGYSYNYSIRVTWEISTGDALQFAKAASQGGKAFVLMNSRGGSLAEALAIGREIRARGFATSVAPGTICASACAFAWLAGEPRAVERSAAILFHHPWNEEDDHDLEAAASAILGAYLSELGMNDRAIWFMTRKGKDSGEFLTEDISRELGIGAYSPDPVPQAARRRKTIGSSAAPNFSSAGLIEHTPTPRAIAARKPRQNMWK